MASHKSRRSRKARRPRSAATPISAAAASPRPGEAPASRPGPKVAPRVSSPVGRSTRRQQREERFAHAQHQTRQAHRRLGTAGERPRSIFHPVPVAEVAILAGLIAVVIGLLQHGGPALSVGAIVCGLGVLESTAREHFSGYRSHATLLAAFPAVLVEVVLALFVGVPTQRILLLAPVVPVFGFSFWLLNRTFLGARHTRVTRPPSA
jgi:Flp pilus assembly protein TadB